MVWIGYIVVHHKAEGYTEYRTLQDSGRHKYSAECMHPTDIWDAGKAQWRIMSGTLSFQNIPWFSIKKTYKHSVNYQKKIACPLIIVIIPQPKVIYFARKYKIVLFTGTSDYPPCKKHCLIDACLGRDFSFITQTEAGLLSTIVSTVHSRQTCWHVKTLVQLICLAYTL